jgi:predicted AlkP superfamily pyrophosphatase or phosphodiesterase
VRDPSSSKNVSAQGNPYAKPNVTLGRAFPHPLFSKTDAAFLGALRVSPFLDELTATFARELITTERLGQGVSTDYLSIRFSSTDYIGHVYGQNSLEAEENLLRLDAALAELLAFIDKTMGLNRTLVVLSADHGVDDIPEERRALGHITERLYPDKIRARVNAVLLKEKFNGIDDLVVSFVPPGFYLDRGKIAAGRLDQAAIENALAEALRTVPGVGYAFT